MHFLSTQPVSGRILIERKAKSGASELSLTIALDGLPAGSYFVRIDDGKSKSVRKLVVK